MKSKRPYFLLIALALIYHLWQSSYNKEEPKQEIDSKEFPISKN